MKRGGTHFDSDARDAMFGAQSTAAASKLSRDHSRDDAAAPTAATSSEVRFSAVLGGWVVEGEDDFSVFETEAAAQAWAAK